MRRIFAQWAIVYFGLFCKDFLGYFFPKHTYIDYICIIFVKKWLGYVLGNFLQAHLVTLHIGTNLNRQPWPVITISKDSLSPC
jgi:hypothetical protein